MPIMYGALGADVLVFRFGCMVVTSLYGKLEDGVISALLHDVIYSLLLYGTEHNTGIFDLIVEGYVTPMNYFQFGASFLMFIGMNIYFMTKLAAPKTTKEHA